MNIKSILATISILTVFIFTSCNDEADKPADDSPVATGDSISNENIDTVLSNETISFFNQSGFSDFARAKAPAFDWSKFRMTNTWRDDSLLVTPFKPSEKFYESYRPFLKYSPDSSMFIDLDSYNLAIEKDKSGRLTATESGPDTEVSLVNTKNQKKTRLVFLGPGSSIEDGSWIDSENLVLMGFQESVTNSNGASVGSRVPVLWRYHLPTTTFYVYEMPDPAIAKQLMGQWRRERLKGLTIR